MRVSEPIPRTIRGPTPLASATSSQTPSSTTSSASSSRPSNPPARTLRSATMFDVQHHVHQAVEEELARQAVDRVTRERSKSLYNRGIDACSRSLVTYALEQTRGNKTQAADLLGVSRQAVHEIIARTT